MPLSQAMNAWMEIASEEFGSGALVSLDLPLAFSHLLTHRVSSQGHTCASWTL